MMPTLNTIRPAHFLLFALALALGLHSPVSAQVQTQAPGPQQLAFAGLRSVAQQGQFNGVATDTNGNVFLLLDQGDGIRLLKTDRASTNVLAQANLGAAGDQGLAMALDPSGNVYVTGQSTSGALSGTSGAAFVSPADSSPNSFVAKFDAGLALQWITFGGSGHAPASAIAATADAVFITGLIYGNGLPVTPGGIIQTPLEGSRQNGFVEKFSADGSTLLYATYLSGAKGDTSPLVIAADALDDAYIAGFTTAPGYPTVAALIPRYIGNAATTGFLTELTPAGDGITFSTYIPGGGITSLAIDAATGSLLLSGNIALGQFPVASAVTPMAATNYQVLLRMPLDGSSVLASTVLAPGSQSYLTPGPNGTVWVDGPLSTPLLPSPAVSGLGTAFAVRVSPQGTSGQTVVDEAFRFGGLASNNPVYAGVVTTLTSLAVDGTGSALIAGGVAPTASSSLLATETFDFPLLNAPTSALPSLLRDAVLAPASCTNSSQCAGGAAFLARVTPTAAASLALSTDASPTILLRNLGSDQATGLQIAVGGFTQANTCGTALNSGAECTIVLSGAGPGTLTVSATNAPTQTANLAAVPSGTTPQTLVFSPRELDFGIQTATSPAQTRTITVTNLGQSDASFSSALVTSASFSGKVVSTPYTFAETTASDCPVSGTLDNKILPAGQTCHIVLSFAASSNPADDKPVQANWTVGPGNVLLTGFTQAAALSLSSSTLDFGTQFYGGLTSPRFLYISNNSATPLAHTAVSSLANPAFTVTDGCPSQLNPHSVCSLQIAYLSPVSTSTDNATLALDRGLSVQVSGQTIPQPGVNGSTAPPSLVVTPSTAAFSTPVPVTGVSSTTQTVTIQNTGTSSFSLVLSLTGDFVDQTNCAPVLAAGASCNVILSFAPSQPGARTGLLGVTAGSGTSPAYVALSGTATAILPANNGTLDFGMVPVGQPAVQWFKVAQPFSTLTAATLSPSFKAVLVEDLGTGHGAPPSTAFLSATTGTCANCWLGLQFTPPAVGAQTASLKLLSALNGNPYVLALTGSGLPPTGATLTPASANFGPVAVGSSSAPQAFTLTNLTGAAAPIAVGTPVLTGDFTLGTAASTGTPCGGTLALNASCTVAVVFAPTATGQRAGTLTLSAGGTIVSGALSGSGLPDPAVSFNPSALIFNNVPGPSAAQQTITIANTGGGALVVGTPTNANPAFQTATTCATLAPAATCTVTVTYIPGASLATDTLQVPVTGTVGGAPVTTVYPLALSATYTAATAGLQITPNTANVGPFPVNTLGGTRQFTVNNLTAKSLAVALTLPREFLLTGSPCTALAPNGSCTFSATFVPVTAGDLTGTLSAQGVPTDGSSPVNGLAFLEGFGTGTNTLAITGTNAFQNNTLNFGQVASGQSAQQTLTLTNTSSSPVIVRRVTSRFPFLASTTCGTPLPAGGSCAITLSYTPLNQIASGGSTPPATTDAGTLIVESDALGSPNTITLTGTGSPAAVSAPSNTAPTATFLASQNSLSFAATAVGFSSAAQTVTLTNTGSSVLHIAGVTTSADFTVTTNCGTLLPAAACTLTAAFAPQVSSLPAGPRLGTVQIASDAGTPLEFLSLLGTAGASTLTLQPSSLAFGTVLIGATTSLPLQITNTGGTPVTFSGIAAAGDYAVSGSCGSTLAAAGNQGDSCTELVSFTPTNTGSRPGTLSIASSASSLPLVAQLSGAGAQTHLQLSPATLSFGNVAQASTASLSLTLANNSTTTSITGLSFTATGDFAITSACAVATLAPGASCSVTVAFTPTTTGTRTGVLTIGGSDPASPLAVPLTGTGTAAIVPPGNGSFNLSASSPSATVSASSPANYTLMVTPLNGFTGQVVLNCAALVAAQYASCSLQPSSVTLNGTTVQTATVTINTVTAARNTVPNVHPGNGAVLCLLAPSAFLFWRFRRSLPRQRWPLLLALLCTSMMFLTAGCGSSGNTTGNFRKTPAGTYQYMVSASSTTGTVVSQSVTLNLIVQ